MTGLSIGIYGGTFDPPHFGHLQLAIAIAEARRLDQVWFCPARVNPFKQANHPTSGEHRLAMLELALRPIPQFKILSDELQREGPSYTIDTLRALISREQERSNPHQFSLILGEDAVEGFADWKEADQIVTLVPVYTGSRRQHSHRQWRGSAQLKQALQLGFTQTPLMEISASNIRERLAKDLFCGHLIPQAVLDYIKSHHLYDSLY